jgi:perosamine synthetase
MDDLTALAKKHSLHVIEDAAHALPATYGNAIVGSISEITAFSFYATKTLSTGEGGMVTTDNDDYANRIRLMRLHGIGRDAWKRYSAEGSWYYEVLEAGYKYNMTDIQAALGLVQLRKCDAMRDAREKIALRYNHAFSSIDELRVPVVQQNRTSAWHLYPLRLETENVTISRDSFISELKKRGIGTSVHFIPLHLHPHYQQKFGYKHGDFPNAESEYSCYFSLPLFPGMTELEIDQVIGAVVEVVHSAQRRTHLSIIQSS